MDQKHPLFRADRKTLIIVGLLIVSLVGIPLTVYFLQQTQIFEQQAWQTSQSASAACDSSGKVVITVNFSNTEQNKPSYAMNVTVRDTITGGTVNLGTINPGETKSGTITTNSTSLAAGGVIFDLTWTNGRSGTDSRTASYKAVAACSQPSPSPSPLPSLSPSPTTITPTITPTDGPTATPPTGTPADTPTPTVTIAITETPTPTTPESPTSTPTPPTEVVTSSVPTNTPFPTIAPSGPETLVVGFGAVAFVLTLIGGLLFFLL